MTANTLSLATPDANSNFHNILSKSSSSSGTCSFLLTPSLLFPFFPFLPYYLYSLCYYTPSTNPRRRYPSGLSALASSTSAASPTRSSSGDSRPQIPIVLFVVRFVILLVSVPNFQNFWYGNFLLFRLFVFFRQHLFVFFVQLFVRVRHFSRNDLVLRDGVWIADDRQLLRHFDRTVPVRALRDRSHGGVFLIVVVFLSRQK